MLRQAAAGVFPRLVLEWKKLPCSLSVNNVAIIKTGNVPKLAADVKNRTCQSQNCCRGFFILVFFYYMHRQLRFAASITA